MFSKISQKSFQIGFKPSFNFSLLKEEFIKVAPAYNARLKEIKTKHSAKKLGDVTVDQVIGGMRGIPALFYDLSKLDPQTVILN